MGHSGEMLSSLFHTHSRMLANSSSFTESFSGQSSTIIFKDYRFKYPKSNSTIEALVFNGDLTNYAALLTKSFHMSMSY